MRNTVNPFVAAPNIPGFEDANLFFVKTRGMISPRANRKVGDTHLVWAICKGDQIKIALPLDDKTDTASLKQWTRSDPEIVDLPILGSVQ